MNGAPLSGKLYTIAEFAIVRAGCGGGKLLRKGG